MIIAKEPDTESSVELKANARNVMSKIYKAITEQECVESISTEELLKLLHVSSEEYYKALSVTMKGRKVILAGKPILTPTTGPVSLLGKPIWIFSLLRTRMHA